MGSKAISLDDLTSALQNLQKKGRKSEDEEGTTDAEFKDVSVARAGKKIVLPEDMSYDEAIQWMKRKRKQEEQEVNVSIRVDAFPLDGACALMDVLRDAYGWTDLQSRMSFFGEIKPTLIDVEIGPNESRQVPWGDIAIPGIEGTLSTGWEMHDDRPCFTLNGTIKRKHEKVIHRLGDAIKQRVKTGSIYRGKAIRMRFRDQDGDRIQFRPDVAPRFEDLTSVKPEELIFPRETQMVLETTLFTPVEFSEACRKEGIPLKRGVLLEGPFGTGKTLTAAVLARICVEHGWTFLYVEDVRDLDMAIKFAKLYQPTVVFGEDIDRAVGMQRDSEVDRILNTLDGIGSKTSEIFVVLTTNEVDKIGPAFLRPGRIDTVVHIGPPDTEAAIRLVRLYGKGRVDATDEEIGEAVQPVVGSNAAFLQEVTERSRLAAIRRTGGTEGEGLSIKASDIAYASQQMRAHLVLTNPELDERVKRNPVEEGMTAIGGRIADAVVGRLGESKVGKNLAQQLLKQLGR